MALKTVRYPQPLQLAVDELAQDAQVNGYIYECHALLCWILEHQGYALPPHIEERLAQMLAKMEMTHERLGRGQLSLDEAKTAKK